MAFSQVIEDKNSPTGKSLVRLSGATDAGSAAAMAVAQEAKQTADAALPKAGGEMTGGLVQTLTSIDATIAAPEASKYVYPWMLQDINGNRIGGLQITFSQTSGALAHNLMIRRLVGDTWKDVYGLSINMLADGNAYATFPHPRPDNYGNDGVTAKAMKDWAAQNLLENKTYYVNPETGSDTADLNAGRGTADKPFKSVRGALSWACTHHTGNRMVTIVLQGDCTEAGTTPVIPFHKLLITSDDTRRALTIAETDSFGVGAGNMILRNITINPGLRLVSRGDKGDGPSSITLDDVSLISDILQIIATGPGAQIDAINEIDVNGAAAIGCGLFRSLNGATVDYSGATFTGSVTGWKYEARNGSLIIAGDKIIPGDGEGICDAHSVIA